MTKLDLKQELINDYKLEEARVKEIARRKISSFLGIDLEDVSAHNAGPNDKGIRVYLQASDYQFMYNYPSEKIEFSLNGQLYEVEKRSDVGRIISFKENKD